MKTAFCFLLLLVGLCSSSEAQQITNTITVNTSNNIVLDILLLVGGMKGIKLYRGSRKRKENSPDTRSNKKVKAP